MTENGYADDTNGYLNDVSRVNFYTNYINELLKAVTVDKCNVKSYTAWSLVSTDSKISIYYVLGFFVYFFSQISKSLKYKTFSLTA